VSVPVILALPFPPSLNRIWRSRKDSGRPYLDDRYKTWKRVVDNIVMATRPRPRLSGPFLASITLSRAQRNPTTDLDNRIKVILDALQRCGIIENDKYAEEITVRWGVAPEGCLVCLYPVIRPNEQEAAAA
jgi:Holliday junction resolvase RusA-like endonuclease